MGGPRARPPWAPGRAHGGAGAGPGFEVRVFKFFYGIIFFNILAYGFMTQKSNGNTIIHDTVIKYQLNNQHIIILEWQHLN